MIWFFVLFLIFATVEGMDRGSLDEEKNKRTVTFTYFNVLNFKLLEHLKKFFNIPELNKHLYQKLKERNDTLALFLLSLGANPNGLMVIENLSESAKSHKITLIPCWQNAIRSNDLEQLKQLKRYGADINACNEQGQSPLVLAATYNNATVTEYLLKEGADPKKKTHQGESAFAIAKRLNSQHVLRLLPEDSQQESDSEKDIGCCLLQ